MWKEQANIFSVNRYEIPDITYTFILLLQHPTKSVPPISSVYTA